MALPLPHYLKIVDTITRAYAGDSTSSTFGGNYEQVILVGLDDLKYKATITMENLTSVQVTEVTDFLQTVGVEEAFLIPLQGEADMVVLLEAGTYKKEPIKIDTFTISFGIIEHKYPGITP